MKKIIYYNKNTGGIYKYELRSPTAIIPVTDGPDGLVAEVPVSIDPNTTVVDVSGSEHKVIDQPMMSLHVSKGVIDADGVDQCVISNIPTGTKVVCRFPHGQVEEVVDDGEISFTSDVVGPIYIYFRSNTHLNEYREVKAE